MTLTAYPIPLENRERIFPRWQTRSMTNAAREAIVHAFRLFEHHGKRKATNAQVFAIARMMGHRFTDVEAKTMLTAFRQPRESIAPVSPLNLSTNAPESPLETATTAKVDDGGRLETHAAESSPQRRPGAAPEPPNLAPEPHLDLRTNAPEPPNLAPEPHLGRTNPAGATCAGVVQAVVLDIPNLLPPPSPNAALDSGGGGGDELEIRRRAIRSQAESLSRWLIAEGKERELVGRHVLEEPLVQADLPAAMQLLTANSVDDIRARALRMVDAMVDGRLVRRDVSLRNLKTVWDWDCISAIERPRPPRSRGGPLKQKPEDSDYDAALFARGAAARAAFREANKAVSP